jgi:hypothetical protein
VAGVGRAVGYVLYVLERLVGGSNGLGRGAPKRLPERGTEGEDTDSYLGSIGCIFKGARFRRGAKLGVDAFGGYDW